MFRRLFSKRTMRLKWDATLVWFRLRYLQADGPMRGINLLSRPQACGRVALFFKPETNVSQLYLGVPCTHLRLLQRMAVDFGFSIAPKPPTLATPSCQRMIVAEKLCWKSTFVAHIVNEAAFVSKMTEANSEGSFWPQARSITADGAVEWCLPHLPMTGLTTKPAISGDQSSAGLKAELQTNEGWSLGRAAAGTHLRASGKLNIYGRQEGVANWLVPQAVQTLNHNPTNLVIIDGKGDLVPQLKRKAAVTRLLGEKITFLDIDGPAMVSGFNPLAAPPGESSEQRLQRWQHWFAGMAVQPPALILLAEAIAAGVTDISGLRQWLRQREREGQHTAVSSLGLALSRLTANRRLREWLEWPANQYDILPEGSLLFACRSSGWDRQQLLHAVLLAALTADSVRLVVHGFPWQMTTKALLQAQSEIVIANGPLLDDSVTILTESRPQQVSVLADRFLGGDPVWQENLELLKSGEGLVIAGGQTVFSSWQRPTNMA